MTINSQVRAAGPFVGNGVTVTFPFAFKIFQASDLLVVRTDLGGTQSTLVLSSDYTVTLNSDQNVAPGGYVALLLPLTSGFLLTITSNVSLLQGLSLPNQGGWFPKNVEDALDRLTILLQQLGFVGSQALRVPEIGGVPAVAPVANRANNLLGFDSNGNPVAVAPVSGSAAALAMDLTSNAVAAKGSGQIGFGYGLGYAVGTVGRWLQDLATSTGATFIGYLSAGSGAVLRTVADWMIDEVKVTDFMTGAQRADVRAGTYAVDVTAAVNAAFVYACSANPVKGVKFPAGGYSVTQAVACPYSSAGSANAGSFVAGVTYTIGTIGTTDFTLIGAASNTVGISFLATGAGSGSGTATIGLEGKGPAWIRGDGIRGTILKARSAVNSVLYAPNLSLLKISDLWVDCNNLAVTGVNTDWDVSTGPSLNNVYENVRVSGYTGIGWRAANNNDCKWGKVGIVNPSTAGLTAIYGPAAGGMLAFEAITTIGGYIDVSAQDVHLGQGCVTQGIRLKFPGLNYLQILGGYHYANDANKKIIEIVTGYQCSGIQAQGHFETKGATYEVVSGGGTLLARIDWQGTNDLTTGGAGSCRFIGAALLNGSGSLRAQIEVKVQSTAGIDWTIDASKFHLVNHESLVGGFRVPDTALAMFNSWVAFGGSYDALVSRNLPGSRVRVFGLIKNGTLTNGTKFANLAAGQNPVKFKVFAAANTTAFLNCQCDNTGALTLANTAASATYIGIDTTIELES